MEPYNKLFIAVLFTLVLCLGVGFQAGRMTMERKLITTEIYCSVDALQWANDSGGVYGVAYGDIFCVDGTRSITDTLETCAHEWAHTHEYMRDK